MIPPTHRLPRSMHSLLVNESVQCAVMGVKMDGLEVGELGGLGCCEAGVNPGSDCSDQTNLWDAWPRNAPGRPAHDNQPTETHIPQATLISVMGAMQTQHLYFMAAKATTRASGPPALAACWMRMLVLTHLSTNLLLLLVCALLRLNLLQATGHLVLQRREFVCLTTPGD